MNTQHVTAMNRKIGIEILPANIHTKDGNIAQTEQYSGLYVPCPVQPGSSFCMVVTQCVQA